MPKYINNDYRLGSAIKQHTQVLSNFKLQQRLPILTEESINFL